MAHAEDKGELMLCIICMTMQPQRASGGEHVIPYAMGGSFTIDRVCIDCDNRLGTSADAGLINLSTIEQRRAELELVGHAGVVPDPDKRTLRKPFTASDDPNHRVLLRPEAGSNKLTPKTLPYVEFEVQPSRDGILIVPTKVYIDPSDADQAETLAKKALRKAGVEEEHIVEEIARGFASSLESVEASQVFEGTAAARVGGHEPGLLKIAYELAWYWLGDAWLEDPVAVGMRDLLKGREPTTRVRGKIYDDPSVAIVAQEGDQRVLHVAYIYHLKDQLLLFIRIFDLLTAGFLITENASGYALPTNNAIVMQNVERRYEEVPFGPAAAGTIVWTHDPDREPFN